MHRRGPDTGARPGRRRPRWWAVLLVQAAGCLVTAFCVVWAAFSVPAVGLWGEDNSAGTRAVGVLASVGAGLGAVSGPLLVGAVRRDRRWLGWSLGVAGALAFLLVAALTADGHSGLTACAGGR